MRVARWVENWRTVPVYVMPRGGFRWKKGPSKMDSSKIARKKKK